MASHHMMVHDMVEDHKTRIQNIKKYYPYFKLMESSFTQFKDGKYADLDMGYFVMAILRFFIQENNFNERYVTYPEYARFAKDILHRDFELYLEEQEEEELISYIFDKLKNDGKRFSFTFFDPADKKKKTIYTRLIESHIKENTIFYSITSDAVEFYLDTKEIKDESNINVEQLLLEKLIQSQNFRSAVEVVRRINNEVSKLQYRKNEVLNILSYDVFEGVKAYEDFVETGIKWFSKEQKLFRKNSELIQKALEKAARDTVEQQQGSRYYKVMDELFTLDTQLKRAIKKHSQLLDACTQLQIKADEIVSKAKLNALRNSFDFKVRGQELMARDRADLLGIMVEPLLGLNIRKTFDFPRLDDLLTYKAEAGEKGEAVEVLEEENYVYEDEIEDERINSNYMLLLEELLECLEQGEEHSLKEFNGLLEKKFGSKLFKNGDYYSFLVHLCQKQEYKLSEAVENPDTFFEEMVKEFLSQPEYEKYIDIEFRLEMRPDDESIRLLGVFEISNFIFRRTGKGLYGGNNG